MTNVVQLDYARLELVFQVNVPQTDQHRARAAKLFAVPEPDITELQRRYAKTLNYATTYNTK